METYGGGAIVVRDYHPRWSVMFEQERTPLLNVLGPIVITIEHVGSTSVPGLAAKPIIDLVIAVRDLSEARSCCIEPMRASGYTYHPAYEAWLPDELFFRKGMPGPWTHHAHVMEPSSPRWEEFILFRDYLRSHPTVVGAYGTLKKALAIVFEEDIAGFRNAKRPFIQAVLAKARTWQSDHVA